MMQCPTCQETAVIAFCRNCGKGVCERCQRLWQGSPHCPDCASALEQAAETAASETAAPEPAAAPRAAAPPEQPPAGPAPGPRSGQLGAQAPHPLLAGLLGFIPGLGAVYNGQYVKGVLHVILFGLLITIAGNAGEPLEGLFVPLIVLFWLYMPIEALRTAQALRRGERIEEMSGLIGALFRSSGDSPAAGVAIIALGVLLLLFTLGVLEIEELLPYWPVLVIALGVYRLYGSIRMRREAPPGAAAAEAPAETAAEENP